MSSAKTTVGAKKTQETKIVMEKRVAARWLSRIAKSEHRLKIFYSARGSQNLANLMRSYRDGKVVLEGVHNTVDIGVKDYGNAVEVWTSDREVLIQIKEWFEKRGYETTGVW